MRPFYTLYVNGPTYRFVFTINGLMAATIELTHPLRDDQHIEIQRGMAYDQLTPDDLDGLQQLGKSPLRLCREAMTMQREYMQGESGFLPRDAQLGQMLFGMDVDDWDSI